MTWRLLLLVLFAPFPLLYWAIGAIVTTAIWLVCLPCKPVRWGHVFHHFILHVHIAPFSDYTDALWVPLYRKLMKPKSWYCVVPKQTPTTRDTDPTPSHSQPVLVDELPVQRTGTVRVVFISDTHGKHDCLDIPDGDVLVHAGDIMLRGSKMRCCCRDMRRFSTFLSKLRHPHKVIIGGNHDRELESLGPHGVRQVFPPSANYLLHETVTVAGVTFFGTPISPRSGSSNRAFQSSDKGAGLATCPVGVDVLLSHSRLSDVDIGRIQPRVHAYGHFHEDYGMRVRCVKATGTGNGAHNVLCLNASMCDALYRVTRQPVVVDIVV